MAETTVVTRRTAPCLTGCARVFGAVALLLALAACGGGDGGNSAPAVAAPANCSASEQKRWLGDYLDTYYFWSAQAPRPDPAPFATADDLLAARLYTGSDPAFPAPDRFSGSQAAESFARFFGEGESLGYGVSVAGLEVLGQPERPLYVRFLEPLSPAGLAGVRRGDEVLSLNGRSAADIIAANDFSALTAASEGRQLVLRLRDRDGIERTVTLISAVFRLSPVPLHLVLNTDGGRRVGYLVMKDMISQSQAALATTFARFRADGVQDLVLDLRYNGGGLVSVGGWLASYAAGTRGAGLDYTVLRHNAQRAAVDDRRFGFSTFGSALSLPRVTVLTGPRTCSASEQVINGLRGAGIEVTTVGDTTCGKPVGSNPVTQCERTYSVINFEGVNARGEGRYFDGLPATCEVAEDFSQPLGSSSEPLLATALQRIDTGVCRASPLPSALPGSARAAMRRAAVPGEGGGMLPR